MNPSGCLQRVHVRPKARQCVGSGVLVSCISFGLIIEGSFDSELATIHLYYIKIVHFTSCVEMSAVESAVHVQHATFSTVSGSLLRKGCLHLANRPAHTGPWLHPVQERIP